MMPFEESFARGQRSAAARQWGEAAEAFTAAARLAEGAGDAPRAWQAWDAAGEAWRREDRPDAAAMALRRAIDLTEPTHAPGLLARVKWAAVLGSLGRQVEASRILQQIRDPAVGTPVYALVLDSGIGSLLALGRKEEARSWVEDLGVVGAGSPSAVFAARFRRSQIYVLDGDFGAAERMLRSVATDLQGTPGGEAGVASAQSALGEIHVLRGELTLAVAACEQAWKMHREAGRRALMWAAEAARVATMVEAGVQPLVQRLDEPLRQASQRGLVSMEISLRTARGMALASLDPVNARSDLDQAQSLAKRAGLTAAVGIALMERATRLPGSVEQKRADLARAEQCLGVTLPWTLRARLARAKLEKEPDPASARALALAVHAQAGAMGMARTATQAKDLLQSLDAAST